MPWNYALLERWFTVLLAVLGGLTIVLTLILDSPIIGSLLTTPLVLGLLLLAAELLYRHGSSERWTVVAAILLVVGAIGDVLVTSIGIPIPTPLPKAIWAVGLALVLYELFSRSGTRSPSDS